MAKDKNTFVPTSRDDLRLILQFAQQGADCAEALAEDLGTVQDIVEGMLRDLSD